LPGSSICSLYFKLNTYSNIKHMAIFSTYRGDTLLNNLTTRIG
jgi:hypothetical protein